MLQLINPDRYGDFEDDLAEMHWLRCLWEETDGVWDGSGRRRGR